MVAVGRGDVTVPPRQSKTPDTMMSPTPVIVPLVTVSRPKLEAASSDRVAPGNTSGSTLWSDRREIVPLVGKLTEVVAAMSGIVTSASVAGSVSLFQLSGSSHERPSPPPSQMLSGQEYPRLELLKSDRAASPLADAYRPIPTTLQTLCRAGTAIHGTGSPAGSLRQNTERFRT